MSSSKLSRLAVPAVVLLIAFLSYASQALFHYIEPGTLSHEASVVFNLLVAGIWLSYYRAVSVGPGEVPHGWKPEEDKEIPTQAIARQRFCRKCDASKPPRSHHCKVCKRCIPKMDHHCPWTNNCVSHFTFPHFLRFLFYAVSAMTYLEILLYSRAAVLWKNRNLPSYLGPTVGQLVLLFILIAINTLTLFLVSITFFRALYALGCNVTTIESWEIERHDQLLRRARVLGGYLDGPDGLKIRIVRQEFPYDIDIWQNICAGMGTSNLLFWLWPLSLTPRSSGLSFETNGFEDPGTIWPPPDPDRMPRLQRPVDPSQAFTYQHEHLSPEQEIEALKRRQAEDIHRRIGQGTPVRRKPFHERFEPQTLEPIEIDRWDEDTGSGSGEEGWQDSGGNRLKDYGVDEDIEFYDDDIPLAKLIQRRNQVPIG